jgi:hypothetical protein
VVEIFKRANVEKLESNGLIISLKEGCAWELISETHCILTNYSVTGDESLKHNGDEK